MFPLFPFVSFFRGKEWDEIFLNSNYLAGIRHAGINGWLRSTRFGSVLEGKGCVGVCDGVAVVAVKGGCRTQRTKDWQNSAASVFSLSKLKSLLHAKSVTNEQDRFSPLASSHSFQIHLLNVCFHASWNNIVTCLGLFLPSSLWPTLSHKSNFYRGVRQICNRALFRTLFWM